MPVIRLWCHVRRIVVILNGIAVRCRRIIEQRLDVGGGAGKTQSSFRRSIDVGSSEVGRIYHEFSVGTKKDGIEDTYPHES